MRNFRFAIILLATFCGGCQSPRARAVDPRAIEGVIRGFIAALQNSRFDTLTTFFEPQARWIESSRPVSIDSVISLFRRIAQMPIKGTSDPGEFVIDGEGDVAWATWSNNETGRFTSAEVKAAVLGMKAAGQPMSIDSSASEWRVSRTFVESAVLRRHGDTWRIVFGHTTPVTPRN